MHLAGGKVSSCSSYNKKDIRFEDILLDVMTTRGEYIKKSFRFQK